jgi:hypothetical protein
MLREVNNWLYTVWRERYITGFVGIYCAKREVHKGTQIRGTCTHLATRYIPCGVVDPELLGWSDSDSDPLNSIKGNVSVRLRVQVPVFRIRDRILILGIRTSD